MRDTLDSFEGGGSTVPGDQVDRKPRHETLLHIIQNQYGVFSHFNVNLVEDLDGFLLQIKIFTFKNLTWKDEHKFPFFNGSCFELIFHLNFSNQ